MTKYFHTAAVFSILIVSALAGIAGNQQTVFTKEREFSRPVTHRFRHTALPHMIDANAMTITGGFIQYQSWMMKNRRHNLGLDEAAWTRELDAMRRARMDTIIIQKLEEDGESFIPDINDREAVDPTDIILNYADRTGMNVYVGLWSGAWPYDKVESADSQLLDQTKKEDIRLANLVWQRYGKHKSFTGWHIPQEIWNINWKDDQNERMRTFFRQVSDHCKRISNNKPVAISPFFSPFGSAHNDTVAAVYTNFLKGNSEIKGAGIDVVILQDGVGTRCWNTHDEIFQNVQPYFRAFLSAIREASKAGKISLWGNVESFKTVQGGCLDNFKNQFRGEPTDFNRLVFQLQAASLDLDNNQPFFEKIVTFDFFHYMSPVHPGPTLTLRQNLYSAYSHAITDPKKTQPLN